MECTRLLSESGNSIITDTQELLECWADHFHSLGKSQSDSNHQLQNGDKSVNEFLTLSYDKEDNVLDCELTAGEIEYAIRHLKQGRAGGADNVSPEHLKFSGPIFRNCLCQILNHICKLEQIPDCFKHGIIIPAFKGKGRDPLLRKRYRGVALTSVLTKVFEVALIQRINPVLEDAGIPQLTQTAYRKGVSCQDSIFVGTECNSSFVNGGDNVYTCFYDLASAFDTVEFSVLLTELFTAGIQGKCWRLIHHWYRNLISQVKLGKNLSRTFCLERVIR